MLLLHFILYLPYAVNNLHIVAPELSKIPSRFSDVLVEKEIQLAPTCCECLIFLANITFSLYEIPYMFY